MASYAKRTDLLKTIFGLSQPVSRKTYAIVGFGLMAVKFVVEFIVIALVTDEIFTPLDFLNPTMTGRSRFTDNGPAWLGMAWILWTLPFLWIAVAMSVRRAIDAGQRPTLAIFILLPVINILVMLILVGLPTRERFNQQLKEELHTQKTSQSKAWMTSALGGIAIAALYGTTMIQASALWESYGVVMFFGTPFIAGVASAYLFNLREPRGTWPSMGVAAGAVFMIGFGLLLFAIEGVVCIFMAAPIMVPLGICGGLVGKAMAELRRPLNKALTMSCLALPMFSFAEGFLPDEHTFVMTSAVTIDAPPEEVWQSVIGFPEITAEPEWFFRLGIAAPLRATIEGQGVGAVRHCEFTTGAFVEPITVWNAPHRLAFDVTEQPEPMFELTPYRHIHPPHLKGSFRSTRGEFRLIELPDGQTRLEGSTWYELKIYPHAYWTLWTDWLVHRIHVRVLEHIKQNAEGRENAGLGGVASVTIQP